MKAKFLLWLMGGEGCDYSIECGTKIIELNSQTFEDAKVESEKLYEDYDHDLIDSAQIISVVDVVDLDINAWKDAQEAERNREEQEHEEEAERQDYERLKKKFQ